MKVKSLFLLFYIISSSVCAQTITCSVKDKELFSSKIASLKSDYLPNILSGETIIEVGKTFIGTPYVAKTLEIGPKETLVINLQGLDCTTFVENVLALSLMLIHDKDDFNSYTYYLEKIRYRDGKLDGYGSRLHYFTEWISNNEQKGFIKNITNNIGGVEIDKNIDFMSTHRELYPFLKEDSNFTGIQQAEINIGKSGICFLPKSEIQKNESLIKSGDIIALTTSIKGLDVTHTGFAIRKKTGRIHLLHASSKGQVVISKFPLTDYLQGIKKNTGIIVSRIQ